MPTQKCRNSKNPTSVLESPKERTLISGGETKVLELVRQIQSKRVFELLGGWKKSSFAKSESCISSNVYFVKPLMIINLQITPNDTVSKSWVTLKSVIENLRFDPYRYVPELPFLPAPVSVSWIPGFSRPPSGIVPGPSARLPWPLLEPALMISPALALLAGASLAWAVHTSGRHYL